MLVTSGFDNKNLSLEDQFGFDLGGSEAVSLVLEAPLMTEDMHEERLKAVEAFGDSFFGLLDPNGTSMERAANPDAIFEDFIRWHSHGDWEEYDHHHVVLLTLKSQKIVGLHKESFQRECPNMEIYGESFGIVHLLFLLRTKPLLDPNREGEQILVTSRSASVSSPCNHTTFFFPIATLL
ncbi:hypothetical protein ACSQ67_024463 [Phaseolus vulgaris]